MIYNYKNTPQLKAWLIKDGRVGIADRDSFDFDAAEYKKHRADLVVGRPLNEIDDAAAFRCLTWNAPLLSKELPAEVRPPVEAPPPPPPVPLSVTVTTEPRITFLMECILIVEIVSLLRDIAGMVLR